MQPLLLNSIHIQGWKSIKDTTVTFGNINILLGANGAGKSNFLSVFDLLKSIADNRMKLYIEQHGGANVHFHYGTKTTKKISISVTLGKDTYSRNLWPGKTRFRDLQPGSNDTVFFTESHYQSDIIPDSQRDTQSFEEWIDMFLSPLILYHFHDTGDQSPLKRTSDIDENRYLFPDGANIAAYLYKLKNQHPKYYEQIIFAIRLIFPEFKEFIFNINESSNTLSLRWKDQFSIDYTFRLSAFSDGTLRFAALATLLLQPKPPKIIIIDEPELGLHPEAINILAELIRIASAKSQILISTQSAQLVNNFTADDILIAEKHNGVTQITRPDSNTLEAWLEDYTLGEIWQKNIIGGNP